MSVISRSTKAAAGVKLAKAAAKRPGLTLATAKAARPAGRLALKAGAPFALRRVARRLDLEKTARRVGELLAVEAPNVAYQLGLAEPPRAKRTAPRVAAGVLVGAGAVYFMEPAHGREHREKLAGLIR